MAYLWLLAGFALFMALIWSVYALNRLALERYGSEPFSLPNAALMLVANLLLFSALAGGGLAAGGGDPAAWVKLGLAAALALWMLVMIARRTRLWIGLYAVVLLSVGAVAILPSLVFVYLARAGDGMPPR